jgi:hypothetical protein
MKISSEGQDRYRPKQIENGVKMDTSHTLEGLVSPIYLRHVGIRDLIQFGSLLEKKIYLGGAEIVGQVL